MMPTVSIIGCGWMGWPCATHLVKAGYTVKGTTTSKDKVALLQRDGIQGFLLNLDTDEIPPELLDSDILFVNFPPGRGAENLLARYQTRIQKVIAAAQYANLRKIIFASTTGVYAGQAQDLITEETAPDPLRESARAMYEAEQHLAAFTDQLTILRFAGLVGPGRKAANFFAGKQNLPNPDNTVNLVHLTDCVQVVSRIIEHDHFGHVYNVVADKHPTRKTYYTQLTQAAGLVPPTFSTAHTSPNKTVSNAKIKKALGFTFQYPDPFSFPAMVR